MFVAKSSLILYLVEGAFSIGNFLLTILYFYSYAAKNIYDVKKASRLQKMKSSEKSIEHDLEENGKGNGSAKKSSKNKVSHEDPTIYEEF